MNNKILIPIILGIFLIGSVIALAIYHSFNADVTVNEIFTSSAMDVSFSGAPGDTFQKNVTIISNSIRILQTEIDWIEDVNNNSLVYATTLPIVMDVYPGENNITINWSIDSGSPIGFFNGTVTFTRN